MLTIVVGTRPQIIKTSPVIKELEKEYVEYEILHTGQHYDYAMFDRYCDDFEVGKVKLLDGGFDIYTTAQNLRNYFKETTSDIVFVPGDTDSAFIAAMVASKADIPVAHLEAGVRQSNMFMQEEKNRRCIDHISAYLFCPTQNAFVNLSKEGVLGLKSFVGDTNYDLYLSREKEISDAKKRFSFDEFDFSMTGGKFGVMTLHRRENVDDKYALNRVLRGIEKSEYPFILPIHPRTEKMIDEFEQEVPENIFMIEPLDYDRMMALIELSDAVVTDSGGVQKEAYFAKKMTVTIAEETPWIDTVNEGANTVVSNRNSADIAYEIMNAFNSNYNLRWRGLFGTGDASTYIVDMLTMEEAPKYFLGDKW